jgi:hypothetical protein
LKNDIILRFLTSPTTKVRRLGYFILITQDLKDKTLGAGLLEQNLLKKINERHFYLEEYCKCLPVKSRRPFITGEITNKDAARRYITTAQEAGLIEDIGQEFFNTKLGNVLAHLPCNPNPFKLTLEQKFFILKLLLKLDYDCLKLLAHLMKFNVEPHKFPKQFQEGLIKFLEDKPEAKKVKERIIKWKNVERYVTEHIKATRLEWLTDLGIVAFWNKITDYVLLKDEFYTFFEGDFQENTFERSFPYKFYLLYFKDFSTPVRELKSLSQDEKLEYLRDVLVKAFEYFKPHPSIHKISADQFIEYSTCTLLTRYGVIANKFEILELLEDNKITEKFNLKFTKMHSRDDTGFIQKV